MIIIVHHQVNDLSCGGSERLVSHGQRLLVGLDRPGEKSFDRMREGRETTNKEKTMNNVQEGDESKFIAEVDRHNNNATEEDEEGAKAEQAPEMAATSAAADGVAAAALRSVMQRVQHAAEQAGRSPQRVRVVAVSKTKPVSVLRQVYDAGHRCFGENYVQELVEKAPQLPEDIEWHFIGNLQSNKVNPLLSRVPNLAMVETVDDVKIANRLNLAVANLERKPLKVLVQVNTSGEESKFGVEPSACVELAKHVSLECPNLEFCGLMTIGMPDYTSTPENFKTLASCRSEVCKALGIPEDQCELSMGMSGDFELAIAMGSTNVRIGSTIFGAREYPKTST